MNSKKCGKCKVELDFIENWATEEYDYFLYQCPSCRKVVVDRVDFLAQKP